MQKRPATPIPFHSLDYLMSQVDAIQDVPKDNGTVEMLAIRPGKNQRHELESIEVSIDRGFHDDAWEEHCSKKLENGKSHPHMQIAVANYKAYEVITGSRENCALAGDNLFVNLDLSKDNLKAGDLLSIGSALLEVTPEPHNGCKKFASRFGKDALTFVNSELGKHIHLRGIYLQVVQNGTIRLGDKIKKQPRSAHPRTAKS